jgi:Tfp pilus assembly protein PilN
MPSDSAESILPLNYLDWRTKNKKSLKRFMLRNWLVFSVIYATGGYWFYFNWQMKEEFSHSQQALSEWQVQQRQKARQKASLHTQRVKKENEMLRLMKTWQQRQDLPSTVLQAIKSTLPETLSVITLDIDSQMVTCQLLMGDSDDLSKWIRGLESTLPIAQSNITQWKEDRSTYSTVTLQFHLEIKHDL